MPVVFKIKFGYPCTDLIEGAQTLPEGNKIKIKSLEGRGLEICQEH